jgi:NifU-like protein involved in Fe-S cluster formation
LNPASRKAYIHLVIDDLYSRKILKLAAELPRSGRLPAPGGTAEKVSKLCGSRAIVDVVVEGGIVTDYAQDVQACALGQAVAAIVGEHAVGATVEELETARDVFRAMLKSGGPAPTGRFAELDVMAAVRDYPARHASSLVAIEAAAEAARLAQDQATDRTSTADAA